MNEILSGSDDRREEKQPPIVASPFVIGTINDGKNALHSLMASSGHKPNTQMEVTHVQWEIDVTLTQENIVQDKDVDALYAALLRLVGERSFITLNLHTQRVRRISRRALEKLQSLGKELEERRCKLYVSHWNRACVVS